MCSRYVTWQIWVRGARAIVFNHTSTLLHGQHNANGLLISTLKLCRCSPIPRMVLISFLICPTDLSLTMGFFFHIRWHQLLISHQLSLERPNVLTLESSSLLHSSTSLALVSASLPPLVLDPSSSSMFALFPMETMTNEFWPKHTM